MKVADRALFVAKAAVAIGADLATAFPLILLQQGVLILVLLAAGVGLVLLRQAFFFSAPWILQHTQLVAFLVNALIDFAEIAVDAFVIVWDAFADVVNVISALDSSLDVPLLKVPFTDPFSSPITAAAVQRGVRYAQEVCATYDNVYTIGGSALKLALASSVCDVARFLHPVAWLQPAVLLLEPLYFGDANPNGGNCDGNEGHSQQLSAVCCGLGAGFILLEAVIPIYIGLLLLLCIGKALAVLVWDLVVLVGVTVGTTVATAFKLLDRIDV